VRRSMLKSSIAFCSPDAALRPGEQPPATADNRRLDGPDGATQTEKDSWSNSPKKPFQSAWKLKCGIRTSIMQ
jgi:hypothetical protein